MTHEDRNTSRGFQLFLTSTATFLDDVKEGSGLFFDAHQLAIRLNIDVDVNILLSLTSTASM